MLPAPMRCRNDAPGWASDARGVPSPPQPPPRGPPAPVGHGRGGLCYAAAGSAGCSPEFRIDSPGLRPCRAVSIGDERATSFDRQSNRGEPAGLRRLRRGVRARPDGDCGQERDGAAGVAALSGVPCRASGRAQQPHARDVAHGPVAGDAADVGWAGGRRRTPLFRRLLGVPAADPVAVQAAAGSAGVLPVLPGCAQRAVGLTWSSAGLAARNTCHSDAGGISAFRRRGFA